jgi:hypothetical protein
MLSCPAPVLLDPFLCSFKDFYWESEERLSPRPYRSRSTPLHHKVRCFMGVVAFQGCLREGLPRWAVHLLKPCAQLHVRHALHLGRSCS